MISVSASDYKGGDYLYRGLSGLGDSIGSAIQRWQQMKDEQTKADQQMQILSQTDNPLNPGKPIIDEKTMQGFSALSSQRHAAAAAGTLTGLQLYQAMQEAATKDALNRANTRKAIAEADYSERRADPAQAPADAGFSPGVSRITQTETGEDLDQPIDVLRVSPNQVRQVPRRGQITYDEGSGMYSMDGKLIRPEDIAAARALKEPSPTPAPASTDNRPFYQRWFSGAPTATPGAQPSATPAATPKATVERVKVISPEGRLGLIPVGQLEAALSQGYKRAP